MARYTTEEIVRRDGIAKPIEDAVIGILIPIFIAILKKITDAIPSSQNQNMVNLDWIYLIFTLIWWLPFLYVFVVIAFFKDFFKIALCALYIVIFLFFSYMLGEYITLPIMVFVIILSAFIRNRINSNNDERDYRYW